MLRRRFKDVVRRQLAMFAEEHGDIVQRARAGLRAYHDEADVHEALERYADHGDWSEEVEDKLYDLCLHYASTLDDDMRRKYVREFDRQARKAYRDLIPQLDIYGKSDWL